METRSVAANNARASARVPHQATTITIATARNRAVNSISSSRVGWVGGAKRTPPRLLACGADDGFRCAQRILHHYTFPPILETLGRAALRKNGRTQWKSISAAGRP